MMMMHHQNTQCLSGLLAPREKENHCWYDIDITMLVNNNNNNNYNNSNNNNNNNYSSSNNSNDMLVTSNIDKKTSN